MAAKTSSFMWNLADVLRGKYEFQYSVDSLSSILIAKILEKDRTFRDLNDLNRVLNDYYPMFALDQHFIDEVNNSPEFMDIINNNTVTNTDISLLLTMAQSNRMMLDIVPNSVLELFRIIALNKQGRIADINCRSSSILRGIIKQSKFEGSVYLHSINPLDLKLSFLNIYPLDKNIEMVIGNYNHISGNQQYEGSFDFVYLMPPVQELGNSQTMDLLENALRMLRIGGQLALLVPQGFLFNKKFMHTRNLIYDSCRINAIINITRPLKPYVNIDFSVILLRKNISNDYRVFVARLKDIGETSNDAQAIIDSYYDYCQQKKVENDEPLINTVHIRELANDFNIAKFSPSILSRYEKISEKYSLVKIGDIAQVLRSKSHYSDNDYQLIKTAKSVPYIRIQDLRDGQVDIKSTKQVEMRRPNETRTETGDILLSISIKIAKTAIISEELENSLFTDGIVVLRPNKNRVYPEYLYLALQSNLVQAKIESLTTGNVVSHLHIDAVRNLEIPLPSLEKQQDIINNIQHLNEELVVLQAKQKDLQDKFKNAMKEAFD